METTEVINRRLMDNFGRFTDGRPNWRVVWSDDEIEKRLVTHTPEGLELLNPKVEERPKYWYAKHRYILERLIVLPEFAPTDLVTKTSYEPIWTFEDSAGNALPPIWDAIELIIKVVSENVYNAGHAAPYKLPEGMGNTKEEIEQRVDKLHEELFGNETDITDALKNDSAVGYGVRQRKDWLH